MELRLSLNIQTSTHIPTISPRKSFFMNSRMFNDKLLKIFPIFFNRFFIENLVFKVNFLHQSY